MLTCSDAPKTLGLPAERAARLQRLDAAHIAPLTALVRLIRASRPDPEGVPFFDPCDGGIYARVLFLLEAPGPMAKSSGFVSRNNPDETAKNLFELQREAGLSRELVLLWNIVPWYVGTSERIRAATRRDIEEAAPCLDQLIGLLPGLQAIVLVGRKAQRASFQFHRSGVRLFTSAHPSPVALNTRPATRDEILTAWRDVATFIDGDR